MGRGIKAADFAESNPLPKHGGRGFGDQLALVARAGQFGLGRLPGSVAAGDGEDYLRIRVSHNVLLRRNKCNKRTSEEGFRLSKTTQALFHFPSGRCTLSSYCQS
jgi:hypothetical protein